MTTFQKVIKYLAIAFAIFLIIGIVSSIVMLVGAVVGFTDDDAVAKEVKTYQVNGEVTGLEIEIGGADLCIKESESFSVESNLKRLNVKQTEGRLIIKEENLRAISASSYKNAVLTVYLPKATDFDRVDISIGAGRFSAEKISARTVDFEFGAGEVDIKSLIATESAEIEGGAGRVTISGGILRGLDIDSGVGELNLTSTLLGNCNFDMGVGKTNLTILGSKDDYKLDIEKGIGSVTVDGKQASQIEGNPNGENRIEINGGIGAISISFAEAEETNGINGV